MVMRTALALLVLCAASSHAFLPKPLAVSRRSSRGLMKMGTSVENELTDPSSKEAMAVAEFRMITEDEANIRKAGGVAIGVATAAQVPNTTTAATTTITTTATATTITTTTIAAAAATTTATAATTTTTTTTTTATTGAICE